MDLKNIFQDVNDAESKKSKPQLEKKLEEVIGKKNNVTFRDDKRSTNSKRKLLEKKKSSSHVR